MRGFLKNIWTRLQNYRRRIGVPSAEVERRAEPRFILSADILWEVGKARGEGELREISDTGLKLRLDRAIVAGKLIYVRPLTGMLQGGPLRTDFAVGRVVYSRVRGRQFEVGVELLKPESLSRYHWLGRIRHREAAPIELKPAVGGPRLTLIQGGSRLEFWEKNSIS